MRLITALLMLVLDPMAVMLTLAASWDNWAAQQLCLSTPHGLIGRESGISHPLRATRLAIVGMAVKPSGGGVNQL